MASKRPANDGDKLNLDLTPSADDILDVAPVNTPRDMADSGKHSRSHQNEDAFSSSSSEGDEGDSEVQSEWDKALRSGKRSMGKASDFFVAPSKSFDSSESWSEPSGANDEARSKSTRQLRGKPPHLPPSSAAAVSSVVDSTHSVSSHTTEATRSVMTGSLNRSSGNTGSSPMMRPHPADDHLSSGVLPDVLMTMRQKIESLTLFDSDMLKIAAEQLDDPAMQESRESLKRSSQQSISAAVLVSLAHKRYERRRLAAMEIEKVVRSLVHQNEIERVRAILLLLSDDYVRSTSEDARKGGVVALAACAIGLKKAKDEPNVLECRDLILASVVHACQDHSQRVRYYATESLFNVVKVVPTMAVQHFFILFEILRSLYADVDADVRSGAELLDKKLKEVIVSAMNAGAFPAEACIPVFARFVYIRNKATKRLTLTWLQELNEKLVASPILEFLHLFLGGIFDLIADPTLSIRESAILFLHSVLPKLLVVSSRATEGEGVNGATVNFDKILQSLVTTMEHPDPFVRKVAMYWMSRIVKSHMSEQVPRESDSTDMSPIQIQHEKKMEPEPLGAASISVRNSVPHLLPGLLLSIGDDYHPKGSARDSFLPDQTTRALAEQTNSALQEAVRRDGASYVQHVDGFIVALREELDSPGGLSARYPAAVERTPYRMDVKQDGTGIESPGWFSSSDEGKERSDDSMVMSRLCALDWVVVLYESVVPVQLKADYAREFIFAIIHQLIDNPPETIVYKSLEVLAKITVPEMGEDAGKSKGSASLSGLTYPSWFGDQRGDNETPSSPMTDDDVAFAFKILGPYRLEMMSRSREVFAALIQLHSYNEALLVDLSNVVSYMCELQPPEFVFVSFAVELDRFLSRRRALSTDRSAVARDLKFVSSFVQNMCHVLLNKEETGELREVLQDCVCSRTDSPRDLQRLRLFHILLHSFSHNLAATVSLCFWVGAYRTTNLFLNSIDPLDINLIFLVEVDRFIETLERPLFRHLHVRMLEYDRDPNREGSGSMLFKALKSLLMILPQSTCYVVLRDRISSVSRFRQSAIGSSGSPPLRAAAVDEEEPFLSRVLAVRRLHCESAWDTIRAESLEVTVPSINHEEVEEGSSRREWLGFANEKDEHEARRKLREENGVASRPKIEEIRPGYQDLSNISQDAASSASDVPKAEVTWTKDEGAVENDRDGEWKAYWEDANK